LALNANKPINIEITAQIGVKLQSINKHRINCSSWR